MDYEFCDSVSQQGCNIGLRYIWFIQFILTTTTFVLKLKKKEKIHDMVPLIDNSISNDNSEYYTQAIESQANFVNSYENNNCNFPYLKEDNKHCKSFECHGRRIFDVGHLFNQILNSQRHEPFDCDVTDMVCVDEFRSGLKSTFVLRCKMCRLFQYISTEDAQSDSSNLDINSAVTLSTISTGIGYWQLNEIAAAINMPMMSDKTYIHYHRKNKSNFKKTKINKNNDSDVKNRNVKIASLPHSATNQQRTPRSVPARTDNIKSVFTFPVNAKPTTIQKTPNAKDQATKNTNTNEVYSSWAQITARQPRIFQETGEDTIKQQVIKPKRSLFVGTGESSDNEAFVGRDNKNKKVWLFLSVPDKVSETIIKDYIMKKASLSTTENEVIVKHIQTRIEQTNPNSKCFQVGISYDLKDIVYQPSFWPKNVAFQRFKFRKQTRDDFINKGESASGNTTPHEETFLEKFTKTRNGTSYWGVRLFNALLPHVAEVVRRSAWSAMEEAAKEEARLAVELGEVDQDGMPYITVVADGAWSKRSYNINYDALSGVGCIIGYRTGKLLFLGIRNKYCAVCARSESKNVEVPKHVCYKNWNKASTGMETDIIVEGFKTSIQLYGLKYLRMVGDGDSSVYRKLFTNQTIRQHACRKK
ncbi:hypothetical protein NQ318_020985 [Aromia moschata]|uniref:Mutator-like transposase domain-containing protein n=1 Tax=Aromia moschata TaxID=1265417 RepID=A0AAV8YMS7_9CUCU|nr:hypothetical protein NQ318_020985 [Aromia moschata]